MLIQRLMAGTDVRPKGVVPHSSEAPNVTMPTRRSLAASGPIATTGAPPLPTHGAPLAAWFKIEHERVAISMGEHARA